MRRLDGSKMAWVGGTRGGSDGTEVGNSSSSDL